jgi:hypothetical protein
MSEQQNPQPDMVNHPSHYNKHPRGIEVIDFVEHMDFCTGNAIKYIARAEYKGNEIQDLQKAIWYIQRKIDTLQNTRNNETPQEEIQNEVPELIPSSSNTTG